METQKYKHTYYTTYYNEGKENYVRGAVYETESAAKQVAMCGVASLYSLGMSHIKTAIYTVMTSNISCMRYVCRLTFYYDLGHIKEIELKPYMFKQVLLNDLRVVATGIREKGGTIIGHLIYTITEDANEMSVEEKRFNRKKKGDICHLTTA